MRISTARRLARQEVFDPHDIHSVLEYQRERAENRQQATIEKENPMEVLNWKCCDQNDELVWDETAECHKCKACGTHYVPATHDLKELEKRALWSAMLQHDNVMNSACKVLNISRHTCRRKLTKHKLFGHGKQEHERSDSEPATIPTDTRTGPKLAPEIAPCPLTIASSDPPGPRPVPPDSVA